MAWEILIQLRRDLAPSYSFNRSSIVDQPGMGALWEPMNIWLKPVDKMTLLGAIARHVRSHPETNQGGRSLS